MSDHKNLIKHSRNYLFADLATKALGFISIPVYTRILTIEEYGITGVFMASVSIALVLFTLSSDLAISRYYYDSKDENDFKEFVGSTISLTGIILCVTISVFLISLPFIAENLSFPKKLTFFLLPVALYQATNQIFIQIYNPLMRSRKIALVSSVQAYLAFTLSVAFMMYLDNEKYYGYVYGNIVAMMILGSYMIRQIKPYYKFSFNGKHFKYILNYCLPYIPYTLSGVVLSQFSRIFMGNDQGFSLTGSYTLTTNIAVLMMIVIGVAHNAWNPYYYRYMKEREFENIDNDYNLIWRITLFAAFSLSTFGYEIACLLSSGKEYLLTVYVIPILVLGYCFYQWAYVYLRNTTFVKRNVWNALCVLASGVLNVVLNFLLVPLYKELGAAMATSMSFMSLLFFSYLTNRYIIREYVPSFRLFFKTFIWIFPFFVMLIFFYKCDMNWMIRFVLKLILYLTVIVFLMGPYKKQLHNYLKNI